MTPKPATPTIYSIPSGVPFLDALAAGLNARAGGDPLALARFTVLLPTRRAVRALGEAFLRVGGGRALLLPRLMPVGDLDAEELSLIAEEAETGGALDLPPAIPELRRRLLLTELVLAWGRKEGYGPLTPGQAAPLAAELARFLDEVQAEGCDFANLAGLVPEELAQHWQQVLRFLKIVTEHWPSALAETGCIDPADRRNRALAAQIAAWRRDPPHDPVIAAGITGGIPAVADLVAAVAALPTGMVVLPGLDGALDTATWDAVRADPAHPQHLLARLLDRFGVAPSAVAIWSERAGAGAPAARRRFVAELLRPAATSERWRGIGKIRKEMLDGIKRLDCPSAQDEAVTVALVLRNALEQPGRTAALVTPDRDLARRVAAELRRWGIAIDDSAGVALNRTPPGLFLRLLLGAAAEQFAPVPLLALLKHPLAAGGTAPEAFRADVRALETAVLRGPRPAPGLAGLADALGGSEDMRSLIARIGQALAPLADLLAAPEAALADLVAAHLAAAEALAASDSEAGAARLWAEAAGESAADTAGELIAAVGEFPPLAGADYPALFEALIAGRVVRPAYGRHPRLAIWGLLEARLQQADLVVLGGLNEGVWPRDAASDPWLSRPMRQRFGLPPPEQRIGMAAHDFAQGMGAREVVLTRAARREGAPAVPSRWLVRLDAVLSAGEKPEALRIASDAMLEWPAWLDRAERVVAEPPTPRPAVHLRPTRLSVTEIETWMRDPYAIYARHVLHLKPLEPLDADPGVADRGTIIHEALGKFLAAFPAALPNDAVERLLAIGRESFGTHLERPGVAAFWWPRFERIAHWFVAGERTRRGGLDASAAERAGRALFADGRFVLTGRADRIDTRHDGTLVIIDYKTGSLPRVKEVERGFVPQLPLEAAIAAAGGFDGIAAAPTAALEYWHLSGGDPPGKTQSIAADATVGALVAQARAGLEALIAKFADPSTPYRAWPRPQWAPRYSSYAHLARVKEWSAAGGGGGGE